MMNLENYDPETPRSEPEAADRWILSRLDRVTVEVTKALDGNDFSGAAWCLYDFTWKEYCDWYLEFIKSRLYGDDAEARARAQETALSVMTRTLALLHPLYPFLTERIWEALPDTDGLLMSSTWPTPEGNEDPEAEREITLLQGAISAIRNMRAEMNVPPGTEVPVVVRADGEPAGILTRGEPYLRSLARVGSIRIEAGAEKPPRSASAVVEGMEIYLPLEGLIDLDAERQRLEKKRAELEKSLAGVDRKLSNANFVSRAPAEVVEQEKQRRERRAADLSIVERNLAALTEEG
jgi:valyl-tRNA synthetase